MYSTKKLSPEEIQQYASAFVLPIEQKLAWGEFQDACNDRIFLGVFGVFDASDNIIAWANIVQIDMGRYQYLWCKNGPVFVDGFDDKMDVLLEIEHLVEMMHATSLRAHPHNNDFLRIHTNTSVSGYQSAFASYIKKTQCIDLTQTEDEILKQMKQKGRYNVRVAGKKGVEVVKIGDSLNTLRQAQGTEKKKAQGSLKVFYNLLQKTTARDGFQGHPQEYYENMMKYLGSDAVLYLAKYEERYVAGIIVTFADEVATYYYGASDHEYRKVMAPYLLQWQAIQDAKSHGCVVYDFLGISASPDDGLAGVTRFKKQFGGYEMEYTAVIDKPLSWRYYVVAVAKKLQKCLRSLRSTIGL